MAATMAKARINVRCVNRRKSDNYCRVHARCSGCGKLIAAAWIGNDAGYRYWLAVDVLQKHTDHECG